MSTAVIARLRAELALALLGLARRAWRSDQRARTHPRDRLQCVDELQVHRAAQELALMSRIKQCLDPDLLLNPGKILPWARHP